MGRSEKGKNVRGGASTFLNKLPSSHEQRKSKQRFQAIREKRKVADSNQVGRATSELLQIACWNLDGINEDMNTVIENILIKQKPDIFFGLETKETKFSQDFKCSIDQYTKLRLIRQEDIKQGGGLWMFLRNDLKAYRWEPTLAPTLSYLKAERCWVKIMGEKAKVAIAGLYFAAESQKDDSFKEWNEDLIKLMTAEAVMLKSQGYTIATIGDYNGHIGNIVKGNFGDVNFNGQLIRNFTEKMNFTIINTKPEKTKGLFTRFPYGNQRPSILDLATMESSAEDVVQSLYIDEDGKIAPGSDHRLLILYLNLQECRISAWLAN